MTKSSRTPFAKSEALLHDTPAQPIEYRPAESSPRHSFSATNSSSSSSGSGSSSLNVVPGIILDTAFVATTPCKAHPYRLSPLQPRAASARRPRLNTRPDLQAEHRLYCCSSCFVAVVLTLTRHRQKDRL